MHFASVDIDNLRGGVSTLANEATCQQQKNFNAARLGVFAIPDLS